MQPGAARVHDRTVQSGYLGAHLPEAIAAAIAAGERELTQAQFFLCAPCDAWIRDHNVIAAIGEHLESEIDSYSACNRAPLCSFYGNRQADMPAAPVTAEHARANVRAVGQ